MYIGRNLVINQIIPKDGTLNFPIDSPIRIFFNYSILESSINENNVILFEKFEKQVPRKINYIPSQKCIEVIPQKPLLYSTKYNLIIKGGDDGPKTHDGKMLSSQVISSFVTVATVVVAPKLFFPEDQSRITTVQKFLWEDTGADEYQIQVAPNATFSHIVWPTGPIQDLKSNSITPDIDFQDGYYYWRVRAKKNNVYSKWSDVYRFRISSQQLPPDETPSDGGKEDGDSITYTIMSVPRHNSKDVSLDTREIRIIFPEELQPEQDITQYIKIFAYDWIDDPMVEPIDVIESDVSDIDIVDNVVVFYLNTMRPNRRYHIFISKDLEFTMNPYDYDYDYGENFELADDHIIEFYTKLSHFYLPVSVVRADIFEIVRDVSDDRIRQIIYVLSKEIYDTVDDALKRDLDNGTVDPEVLSKIRCYIRWETERILVSDAIAQNIDSKTLADFSVRYGQQQNILSGLPNLLNLRAQKCLEALKLLTGRTEFFFTKRGLLTEPDRNLTIFDEL